MVRSDIVVEFVGVPGSGKTTLATALAARLAAEFDIDFPDLPEYPPKPLVLAEALRLDLRYLASTLGYRLSRLVYDIRRSGIGLWVVSNAWVRSRYPLVRLDRARRAPRQFHVFDEWLLHRTIGESIDRYDGDTAFSRRFAMAPAMGLRRAYVCVDVDHDLAVQRVLEQDHPFRWFARGKKPLKIDRVLSLWRLQLHALKAEITARGLPLICVDGRLPIESNAALLYSWLTRLSGPDNAAHPTSKTPHEAHLRDSPDPGIRRLQQLAYRCRAALPPQFQRVPRAGVDVGDGTGGAA